MRDAASQLEFLKEVGSAGVGSLQAPDLLYLQGLLAWKEGRDLSQVGSPSLPCVLTAALSIDRIIQGLVKNKLALSARHR